MAGQGAKGGGQVAMPAAGAMPTSVGATPYTVGGPTGEAAPSGGFLGMMPAAGAAPTATTPAPAAQEQLFPSMQKFSLKNLLERQPQSMPDGISSTGVPFKDMVMSQDAMASSVKNPQDRIALGLPPLPTATTPDSAQNQTMPFTTPPSAMQQPLGANARVPQFTPPNVSAFAPFQPPQATLPVMPPQQTQPPALAPTAGFDVNQASAGALQQAMQTTQSGLGFTPRQIGAARYTPAQIAGTNLQPYTNPYETQVVDQSLADLERARQMQQNIGGAQATRAGAFGGSRHGIAEAETNRAFAEQAARTSSGLRQQGYQTALGLAGQDVGAQTAASRFGAEQLASAQSQNLAAQQAAMNMRLGAAGQLAGLGQQAFGTGQAIQQQQMQQGLMQQGLQQALIDAARGQYAGYTGAPQTALQAPLAALGATPTPQTTTQSRQPGLFDYFRMGAQAYALS
jgi:hypothetical protein